jgi:hypothetical protein
VVVNYVVIKYDSEILEAFVFLIILETREKMNEDATNPVQARQQREEGSAA